MHSISLGIFRGIYNFMGKEKLYMQTHVKHIATMEISAKFKCISNKLAFDLCIMLPYFCYFSVPLLFVGSFSQWPLLSWGMFFLSHYVKSHLICLPYCVWWVPHHQSSDSAGAFLSATDIPFLRSLTCLFRCKKGQLDRSTFARENISIGDCEFKLMQKGEDGMRE